MNNITRKIKQLLATGEGLCIEFKKANSGLPSNLFDTVVAFLNRSGGEILLGVEDNGQVVGIEKELAGQYQKQISNLSNNPQFLYPSFLIDSKVIDYKGKTILYLYIPVSSQVHRHKGKIYDRGADGDFELKNDEQIRQAYIRKSSQYSENKIYPFVNENDFADGIVERVRKMIRIYRPNHPWNELSNDEFFKITGLFRRDISSGEEGFTLAAILLFGKEEIIHSALPHYKIDAVLRRENTDRYDDRDNIRCNLIEAYDRIMAFVGKHLPDKFYLQGTQRVSLRDKIFREVAANMLIHREYSNAFPSSFIIYADKVIAQNANKAKHFGRLEPGTYKPFPKNPDIANVFTQIGHSEELGTGIQNVYKYTEAYSGNTK
ncbi:MULTISPECIES: AlbA family DNA-binding domain-containing protein [unclassified Carboxylicivirga]|uniref:AlbA family DNA-binding domain-containing protein n=1 Tax=Carboxylicivirga TaxID=1628153 RepID=UPI003D345B5E